MDRRTVLRGAATGVVAAVGGCVGGGSGGAEDERERSFAPPEGAAVTVRTTAGDVTVGVHDARDVAVTATVRGPDEAAVADAAVEGAETADGFEVTAEARDWEGVTVALDVRVPADRAVNDVRTDRGAVTVRDVPVADRVVSAEGAVTVRRVGAFAEAYSRRGDVDAAVPAPLAGETRVHAVSGAATARVSPDANADVSVHADDGDAAVEGVSLSDREDGDGSVDGVLGDGSHPLTVLSEDGDATLSSL